MPATFENIAKSEVPTSRDPLGTGSYQVLTDGARECQYSIIRPEHRVRDKVHETREVKGFEERFESP